MYSEGIVGRDEVDIEREGELTEYLNMDIVDIPTQVARALKYSVRSRCTFLLSLLSAFFLLGISFDLLYGFSTQGYSTRRSRFIAISFGLD